MVTQAELADYLHASETTYGFLAQMLFRELPAEAIEALREQDWPRDTGNETLDRGYGQVRRFFSFASTDTRTQLAVEYARIFLAAGVFSQDTATAVPYESVFTSEGHLMMQESRDDVVRRYAADGFTVNPQLHEPEDHLAFELEYLAHMSTRALVALEQDDLDTLRANLERQRAFVDAHLLNWIGNLHDVAAGYAKTTFYTGMLLIAQGALEQSRALLDEVLGQLAAGAGLPKAA